MQLRYQIDRLHEAERLDPLVSRIEGLANVALPDSREVRDALHGTWLGHPLHPVLVDLPIGFWTSAFVLDLFGGERTARAAQEMVGAGVLAALPAALTGLNDWQALGQARAEKRVGVVHAVSNGIALTAHTLSWFARRRGRRGTGVLLSLLGSAAATVGGYLGGHLAYRQAVGVDHTAAESRPGGWTRLMRLADLAEGRLSHATAGEAHLVVYRQGEEVAALAAHCAHLAGPLHEGHLMQRDGEACVQCPWHGSTFAFSDGRVVHGPSTAPQPGYEARVRDGFVEVKPRPLPKSENGKISLEAIAGS